MATERTFITKQNLLIYYFSGTGNAKRVATWIMEVAEKNDFSTNLL